MTTYHVATTGLDEAAGDAQAPFRTIGRAAEAAQAGDTVVVHAGEYREWVSPRRGGRDESRRITYQAADGEHVVIKGSERITSWVREAGAVWRAEVPNTLFGGFNPYAQVLFGDWLVRPTKEPPARHLGEVYLNGASFYEADSRADLDDPPRRETVLDDWTVLPDPIRDPDQTQRVWYAEVGPEVTTIWANVGDADPNAELTEINVRRSVFYPREHHIDYITVRGFELAHAACPWTPPTADQPGLIGPNWAKGWIIEDCDIHDAKCSGVSLGKEASTGDNWAAERGDRPGHQYQIEAVFAARAFGWDAEHIGGHIVRRNTIHDCGQNGIVGHLGCVFSTIEDNHIHHIALKREFYGYEIGGIKLHAAIDVTIRNNRIHDCSLGTWLDWQAQGTRYSRNVLYANNRDLFIEVSHGPYVVDHNIFASAVSLENFSQGGAYVNNLFAGLIRIETVLDRATPYHRPHSTQVTGYAIVQGGDDRFIGNLFVGSERPGYRINPAGRATTGFGTAGYDGYPASVEEYRASLAVPSDHDLSLVARQAVAIRDNVYAGGAKPFRGEAGAVMLSGKASVVVVEDGGALFLDTTLPAGFAEVTTPLITGADLGHVRFVGASFEDPDGCLVSLDADVLGNDKIAGARYAPGPVGGLASGTTRTRLPDAGGPRTTGGTAG